MLLKAVVKPIVGVYGEQEECGMAVDSGSISARALRSLRLALARKLSGGAHQQIFALALAYK